jgi:Na+-transporting NADH:ubiquinone oxidoreductase subunit B
MAKQAGRMRELINWQPAMGRVLYALIPATAASIYFFGWRSLLLLAVVCLAGWLTEYLFLRQYREPASSAVFVTAFIFTLSLPPTLPVWMAVVGIVFGVLFGKMVFGGFGRNVFNPAMIGRAFIYVSFGRQMTAEWVEPLRSFPGGLAAYVSDAITEATPLAYAAAGQSVSWLRAALGSISGSLGETSAILLLIGGLYLVWTRTASYRIVAACFLGFLATQAALWLAGVPGAADPLTALLTGSVMMGGFFVATDPVSASQTNLGRWIYGAFVGIMIVLIRVFSVWAEGTMFAVLLGNMFAPIMDYAIRQSKAKSGGAKA